jgi:predicted N-formylglutamate amidohydrolase
LSISVPELFFLTFIRSLLEEIFHKKIIWKYIFKTDLTDTPVMLEFSWKNSVKGKLMNVPVKKQDLANAQRNAQQSVIEVINPAGCGRFVLVCEHASNFIPDEYNNLGLSKKGINSHAAWDPGAREIAVALSEILDAPLVASRASRLLFDCNRPPTAKNSIPERSEIYEVTGNIDLSKDQVSDRAIDFYFPFRNALSECLGSHSRRVGTSILVTIHTFTPVFLGRKRAVELGIVHDSDSRMADGMLNAVGALSNMKVARNQPYGPRDGVTHTLKEHGNRRGIANVMIEIRNDLVATGDLQSQISTLLGSAIATAADNMALRVS